MSATGKTSFIAIYGSPMHNNVLLYHVWKKARRHNQQLPDEFLAEFSKISRKEKKFIKGCSINMSHKDYRFSDAVNSEYNMWLSKDKKVPQIDLRTVGGEMKTLDFKKEFNDMLKEKNGAVAIIWVYTETLLCWVPKIKMNDDMRAWKNQRKSGIMSIYKKNNRTFSYNGKQYYSLVLSLNDIDDEDMPFCLFSALFFNFRVHGVVYYFTSEKNRDAVYTYVMGNKNSESDTVD